MWCGETRRSCPSSRLLRRLTVSSRRLQLAACKTAIAGGFCGWGSESVVSVLEVLSLLLESGLLLEVVLCEERVDSSLLSFADVVVGVIRHMCRMERRWLTVHCCSVCSCLLVGSQVCKQYRSTGGTYIL